MRIASLAPSVTEILFELGQANNIVCSTVYCDFPEAAKNLPKIGGWVNIDVEKLIKLKPDIVFTSSAVQGNLTTRLRTLGLNVVNINPVRLADVVESYNQIGQLVGAAEPAERISQRLYQLLMSSHATEPESKSVRVYCEEWADPPMAAGNWVPELVELAGGAAAITKPGELSREFQLSELINFNPHVIVMHLCGFGTRAQPEQVMHRPGWEVLDAIRAGEVTVVDDSLLNRPTSRLFEGLKKLKEIVESAKNR